MDIVRSHAMIQPATSLPLLDCLDRVLSAPVTALEDYPRFDVSAMDGYALAACDTASAAPGKPVVLPLMMPAFAGAPPAVWRSGQAVPISTGARIPIGCDTVVARERATIDQGRLIAASPEVQRRHIRRRGEDARAGECVLDAGRVVSPGMIGALASYGISHLPVRTPPQIALFATGDELIGGTADGIFDSNTPMITAALRGAGLNPHIYQPAKDDRCELASLIDMALAQSRPQIIVSTGGVSAGDRDYVLRTLEDRGAAIRFHGVSMRPGKPVLFATLPCGALYFGLPGNPVAALLGVRFFVMAAIREMVGLPPEVGMPVPSPIAPNERATSIYKVLVDSSSMRGIEVLKGQQSHILRPLLHANAWLVVDPASEGQSSATLYPLDTVLGGGSLVATAA
jgi:molybdopterin molybdotransferase